MAEPQRSVLHQRLMFLLRNSVGCRLFRNFLIEERGEIVDTTKDGVLSCAFFVSAILRVATFRTETPLIDAVSLSNNDLIDDHQLRNNGWIETEFKDWHQLRPGVLIFWERIYGARHCGFIMEQGENPLAISNSSSNGMPILHHPTFNGRRRIIHAFWHPLFNAT